MKSKFKEYAVHSRRVAAFNERSLTKFASKCDTDLNNSKKKNIKENKNFIQYLKSILKGR